MMNKKQKQERVAAAKQLIAKRKDMTYAEMSRQSGVKPGRLSLLVNYYCASAADLERLRAAGII